MCGRICRNGLLCVARPRAWQRGFSHVESHVNADVSPVYANDGSADEAAVEFGAMTARFGVDTSPVVCHPSDMKTLVQKTGARRQHRITVPA